MLMWNKQAKMRGWSLVTRWALGKNTTECPQTIMSASLQDNQIHCAKDMWPRYLAHHSRAH